MNLPNKLTMMRLFLVPVFVALVFLEIGEFARFNDFIAFAVFAIASFTDYLDGHLARKWNMVTDFGKLFDSAADKLLCGSALMVLIYVFTAVCTDVFEPFVMGAFAICVTVFAVVIICRELFMTAFRSVAASKNVIIAADMPGKIKTVAQMLGICALLLVPDLMFINHTAAIVLFIIGFVGLAFGTLMAVLSCVLYLRKYPQVFSETK
ncbi:MAG TPA: CDP-diacylglycerol--glycerol-3-phosphate 3-phosphatidyltransferase [Firmicutes bacterium]|nr:CDP-diacylglycerol--glycerol-3-phosphate 3-phosphatidyltransferase [Bacillota bacterium]